MSSEHTKSPYPSKTDSGISIVDVGVAELPRLMEKKQLTSKELTQAYIKRIEDLDKRGPTLLSVIEINPEAEAIASLLDVERQEGRIRGPLHGIPVLVKDNIDTGDQMATSAGSLALANNRAKRDAFIVKRLRDAGAVILGKTNMSEWANFRSNYAISGWSSRGGQTRNPHALDRNPHGSSSGSGSAVAASLCSVAIGTETNGSIVHPSSAQSLVGIKPTIGLVSRDGIIPVSPSCDTAGPMARTVEDAAILLGVLAGVDAQDPTTTKSDRPNISDYTQFLAADGLKNKRIGIEKAFLRGHEGVVALYREAIKALEAAGAVIVEVELFDKIQALNPATFTVFKYEFRPALEQYLSSSASGPKSLAEVVEFNRAHEAQTMPFFKQDVFEECLQLEGLDSPTYQTALEKMLTSRAIIGQLISSNRLDALTGTTAGLSDRLDCIFGDRDGGFYFGLAAAISGYPHITVPMGAVRGLPMGISFMAGAFQEPQLLSIAFACEQAMRKRESPSFKSTIDL